jgi:hypothetical protein
MSIESMAIALHHSRATSTTKLILLGIANHDGDGGAWPSQITLAKYAGLKKPDNVRSHVRKLVELGEVSVDERGGGLASMHMDHRPHLYQFLLTCPADCDRTSQHRMPKKKKGGAARG